MKLLTTILITGFMSIYFVKAQSDDKKWIEIDSLFADGLYKTAIEKLNVIYGQSLKKGNDVQLVKSIIYRQACQQYTEENVTVAAINTLRNDLQKTKSNVAQSLINSLLGEAFLNYYRQNRWKYYNRTDVNDDKSNVDVTTWSLNRIFNECIEAYKRSLVNSDALCKIKINYINDILAGNEETREYRPTLYDFVAHRAISAFANSELRITTPKDVFLPNDENLFTFDAGDFAKMQISSNDSTSNLLFALNILQQLTKFHLQQNDVPAIGDITLKRFDFLINNSTLQNKKSLVMSSLQKFIETTEKNDIWFETNYKLAVMYSENGENAKALETCETALQQKNIGEKQKNRLEQYVKYIKCPSFDLKVENINIPNEPIKVFVDFKDVSKIYFRMYKIRHRQGSISYMDDAFINKDKEKYIEKNAQFVKEWSADLPQTADYKKHSTEIIINSVAQGQYIIVASDKSNFFNADEKNIAYIKLNVSSISYIYKDINSKTNEIYLANRMTGEPLPYAHFKIMDKNMNLKKEYTSNSQGIIRDDISANYNDIIAVVAQNDSLIVKSSAIYVNRYSYLGFKDDIITKFFLDRAIYRPGQTVYFKGIVLNYDDNKYSIAVGEKEEITLNDPNDEELATINAVSNEYGTFSGSFVLPQSVLGGKFTIESDYGEIGFYVEEYKRPTFEVKINPVEKNHKFNETVNISGLAKSYAGYNIDNAKVSYGIVRRIEFPYRWWYYGFNAATEIIANGETKTDENGNFNISFFAGDSGMENDMQIAVYNISVDITDNNGETHSTVYGLRMSKKPLVIKTNIPEEANIADSLLFDLFTENLNGNPTISDITVNIYKLKQPEKPLRKRLWGKPDKPVLTRDEYKKLFPYDAYEDEDKIENFEEIALVKTVSFNTAETKKINLDELKQYGSASYRFDITAKNAENITTDTKTYIQLQDNNTFTDMTNWVRKGKQTEKEVEFFAGGIGDATYVHYDVKYRNNLIESKNIIVDKTLQSIKISIPETKNNEEFSVSFASIFNNRVYTSQHVIKPYEDKNDLDISLVTFRDKMQPGEKEQWKLSVKSSNNEKAMAEMVASLYDASLDAFVVHDWNENFAKNPSLNYNYYYNEWHESNIFGSSNSVNLSNVHVNIYFPAKIYDRLITADYIRRHANYTKTVNKITKTEGKIKGIAVDENYEPLAYVSVSIKNEPSTVTTADENGEFEIAANKGDVLVFSYIGYITQEITVYDDVLSIVLLPDSNMLEENVAVGYSVARKESALSGKVAGV
ncbi:MAG: carboxypeptidase-like regulatory domain-containing protein, partial [Prevotellaceae bacterium]|nr:carboxypeptidase-like regulatory domain-containing protein [Prevotellaceae bacterium]